ncbi:hypothetical protein L596_021705 [Steinernema carpocapsae]|uniref:G-protein coupled receptors family 1 profile domain-containing protein n=1 Tax=Steinernema carpocapsae TaxID=34508 RepID=A0A4U5MJL1_STECR|nr:hypothetical protein L596_021705 [Steinernema carpocapsae]
MHESWLILIYTFSVFLPLPALNYVIFTLFRHTSSRVEDSNPFGGKVALGLCFSSCYYMVFFLYAYSRDRKEIRRVKNQFRDPE